MEIPYLLIITSFLLSVLLFFMSTKKEVDKINRQKLFSIVSIIFLFVLGLCVYFITDVNCKNEFFNPFLVLIFPIFLGFVIWSIIYSIRYKIFLVKIVVILNIFISILSFFARERVICLD